MNINLLHILSEKRYKTVTGWYLFLKLLIGLCTFEVLIFSFYGWTRCKDVPFSFCTVGYHPNYSSLPLVSESLLTELLNAYSLHDMLWLIINMMVSIIKKNILWFCFVFKPHNTIYCKCNLTLKLMMFTTEIMKKNTCFKCEKIMQI